MIVKSKKLESSLRSKGFERSQKTGSHRLYIYCYDGRETDIRTFLSHGSDYDISDRILSYIKKQLYLDSTQQVAELANCPLTKEGLASLYESKGLIKRNKISNYQN
jgi:predicted RNA binding protein YcfA (HicA-like mRNA interferase family)